MLSINTNLASLIAQNSMSKATDRLNLAIERMASGAKINHAKDNAANYSISTNLTTKIGAYDVAADNVAMGMDLIATANGSLDQISDKLQRLRDLAEQASNGTYGEQSLKAINTEANALVDEINRLYSTAEYNGISLYDKTKGAGCDMESLPEAGVSGFIKEVKRRDTTNLTKLADVAIDQALTAGTYSISTSEELAKLATMTNNGLIGSDTEFVLANDIDLSGYSNWTPIGGYGTINSKAFRAIFDGNGYKICNLNQTNPSNYFTQGGLFGYMYKGTVKNLGIENSNIVSTKNEVGGLIGTCANGGIVDNCYITGKISGIKNLGGLIGGLTLDSLVKNSYSAVDVESVTSSGTCANIGGLVGNCKGNLENCFATGEVTGCDEAFNIGGLVGVASGLIRNCFATGGVAGEDSIGGLAGWITGAEGSKIGLIQNCYASGNVNLTGINSTSTLARAGGLFGSAREATLENCTARGRITTTMTDNFELNCLGSAISSSGNKYNEVVLNKCLYNANDNLNISIASENVSATDTFDYSISETHINIDLQVGIDATLSSSISLLSSFKLSGLSSLRNLGISDNDYLTKLDTILKSVWEKSTEFGAIENRLQSALESIEVNIENLTASLSTIRDADIAEVSSEYIRQQILQQAASTLLATANQSPSIALQLI